MIISVKCFNMLRMIKKYLSLYVYCTRCLTWKFHFTSRPTWQNVLKSGIESVLSGFYLFLNRMLEKATPEDHNESQKLIPVPDNDIESDSQKKERSKSSELLKQELEKHGRTPCRDYILKVNLAMSVLYARQLLASLLAQWPDQGPVITAELLGCKDPQQIPCVLDLLNKSECRSRFHSVSLTGILYCCAVI